MLMIDIFALARYVIGRYEATSHEVPDDMKLHKLLYFIQRECIVRYKKPLFAEQFEAWRYGPVMRQLRESSDWRDVKDAEELDLSDYSEAIDFVFAHYAPMKSWSLSSISHGETCWEKANAKEKDSHPVEILTEDIFADARNIAIRRLICEY